MRNVIDLRSIKGRKALLEMVAVVSLHGARRVDLSHRSFGGGIYVVTLSSSGESGIQHVRTFSVRASAYELSALHRVVSDSTYLGVCMRLADWVQHGSSWATVDSARVKHDMHRLDDLGRSGLLS